MFTGIVQAVGRVAELKPAGQEAVVVAIEAGGLDLADVAIGDSIACNGVCLTVTQLSARGFSVDVSQETVRVTTGFAAGATINLEKSLRLADRLGGHLVSGHVDGVGTVRSVEVVDGNRLLTIAFPAELARYFARKGSAAVNGVSLTLNSVEGDSFCVNLIPHTLQVTNLGQLKKDGKVNLEVDLVARYVERMLGGDAIR
jgi:riboflavin synthase